MSKVAVVGLNKICWLLCIITLLLGGCSILPFMGDDEDRPQRIKAKGPKMGRVVAGLPELKLPQVPAVELTRDDVMAAYNRVYGQLGTTAENYAVGKRLADLHMEIAEEADIDGASAPYEIAIDRYETLLAEDAHAEQADAILYQLARGHDLASNPDRALDYLNRLIASHPDSVFIPEARFRRAEIRFSAERYKDAAEDYTFVVNLGEQTSYFRNATYMLGWSEFKRMRFDEGLAQFFNVLDSLLQAQPGMQSSDDSSLTRELLDDTFRVVNLALSYLDGAATLAQEMQKRGHPDWQYQAYQRLAQDYFSRERFLDSVNTWQVFIEHNPLDLRAPAAHEGMVKTLIDAGFPADVLNKKQQFIERYGVYSMFWEIHGEQARESYVGTLHQYLSEVAKLAHADAQNFEQEQAELPRKMRHSQPLVRRAELYLTAARWYEEMTVTFPNDPRTAEYVFLLGETFTEAQEPAKAVAAYQRVVRDFPEYVKAPEAGYAAILGLSNLVSSAAPEELELWQRLKIDAQIEFALVFPGDPRAPSVQADAADTLFAMGETQPALDLAENLLLEWPNVEAPLKVTALKIIGHGRFEQAQYAAAESAYLQLLALALSDEEQTTIRSQLVAAVYKQGEAAEERGELLDAVGHYLRIASIDAAAPLAAQGHFDAIAVVETAGDVARAAQMLEEFRNKWPGHELGKETNLRLAAMYEKTNNLIAATKEYVALSETAPDAEVRRQSLYRAAELSLETKNHAAAIEYFRDYAHTYKQPVDLRLEAMHRMDELYVLTDDPQKRRFWLAQKIKLHRQLGTNASERATFLAAEASMVLADDARLKFAGVRLGHPLKNTLRSKQRALKQAVKAYEKVADYKVAQFNTAATFQIADLYANLSKSLLSSARPKNLSELELEQYEILLEEQAFPFEEQAMSLHEINQRRAWDGTYDSWVERSFSELARLMPARFDKVEQEVAVVDRIH